MEIYNKIPFNQYNFGNFARNEILLSKGYKEPPLTMTGTTIAGAIYKDGVVLGADTRATRGSTISQKRTIKLNYIQPNIVAAGAGVSADCSKVTEMVSSGLELLRLNTNKEAPVIAAVTKLAQYLFRYQGYVGAHLILGGTDRLGSHIYSVTASGTYLNLNYTCLGSGSLSAQCVIESRWKENMELEDCKKMIRDAIFAGVYNDCGSGNMIDLCVISNGKTEWIMAEVPEVSKPMQILSSYSFKAGSTPILSERNLKIEIEDETVHQIEDEPMDTL